MRCGGSDHLSHEGAGFGVKAESYAVIRDPLVVARFEKTIGRLNDRAILLTISEPDLSSNLLERRVASVVIGIGVGMDGQGQLRGIDSDLLQEWKNRFIRCVGRACVQQNGVVADK